MVEGALCSYEVIVETKQVCAILLHNYFYFNLKNDFFSYFIYVCTMDMQVPEEARRGHRIPWSFRLLCATWCWC